MPIGPYQISLQRTRRPRARLAPVAASCLVASMALLAVAFAAGPASADDAATGTVALSSSAVTSITVSPNTFGYDECVNKELDDSNVSNSLPLPSGACFSSQGAVSITNGGSPSTIEVSSTGFAPSDGLGPDWTLCAPSYEEPVDHPLPACTDPTTLPGTDQAFMMSQPGVYNIIPEGFGSSVGVIGSEAGCDPSWTVGSCAATAGQTQTESLGFRGPSGSTDLSASFSNVITWVAVSS
jgi:hypothetical protein